MSSLLANPTHASKFIYGTAWKKEETFNLVTAAVKVGFRAIDTAAQPKHYREDLVGEALRSLIQEGFVKRDDLFLQTKFTPSGGQDLEDMPYDPSGSVEEQIHDSVASSLYNLRPAGQETTVEQSYIDCFLLHSPMPKIEETLEAWTVLQSYVPHKIRSLGISNCSLSLLKILYDYAQVKPVIIQNRFYPDTEHDTLLRRFCNEREIVYEAYWTITGNTALLRSDVVTQLSKISKISLGLALYFLIMGEGVVVLNGTSSTERMVQDIDEIERAKEWSSANIEEWGRLSSQFHSLLASHK